MGQQQDQTEVIVLGISLLITAFAGYMSYTTYKAKEKKRTEDLPQQKQQLKRQRQNLQEKQERLANVSQVLGWKYLFLQLVPAEDHEREYMEEGGRYDFASFPDIQTLEEEGRLAEHTEKVMKNAGFEEEYINKVTADRPGMVSFLKEYYRVRGAETLNALTSVEAMARHLNQSLSIVSEVEPGADPGALSEQDKWSVKSAGENGNGIYRRLANEPTGITLVQLLEELNRLHKELDQQRNKLKENIDSTRKEFYTYTKKFGDQQKVVDLISKNQDEISNLRSRITSLRGDIEESHEKLVDTLHEAGVKVWEKQMEKNRVLDRQRDEREKRKDEIAKFQKRLEALQEAKETDGPDQQDKVDARILTANQDAQTVFIDIGRKHGLFTGTEFQVYDVLKGGKKVNKGTIKVTKLFEDHAKANIINQNDPVNHPMDVDDYVQSEEFAEDEYRVFVFAGYMQGDYDRSMLREVIQKNGHRVDPEVTTRTTYLVVGKGYSDDPDYSQAEQLGVEIISQKQLERMFDLR